MPLAAEWKELEFPVPIDLIPVPSEGCRVMKRPTARWDRLGEPGGGAFEPLGTVGALLDSAN